MSDDVLSMPPGHELNAKVHAALGGRVFSEVEMREEALSVWKQQPNVQSFMMGFTAFPANDEARARGFDSSRPGDVVFRQNIRAYSTDGGEAVSLAERFHLTIECYPPEVASAEVRVNVSYSFGEQPPTDADGPTIACTVARWVAAHVRDGEVAT